MRRKVILAGDVLAFGALIAWCKSGLWIDLLGFSTYHSRGDVWLPTPAPALNILMGLTCTAMFLFGAVFLLTSGLIFLFGGSPKEDGGHLLYSMFYGRKELLVKYFAYLSSSVVVPLVVYSIRQTRPERVLTIFAAFGVMLVVFVVIVFIGHLMLSRSTSR